MIPHDEWRKQMSHNDQQVGLAQLSLVRTAPPELVRIAAEAGFDFIGARVRQVTAAERPYDLRPGSPMLAETLRAVRETGVLVKDVEFLLLDGSDQRPAWLEMMRAGQALGATSLTVAASMTDTGQLTDILARMSADGLEHGITPTLEVISYQAVNSLSLAAQIATAAGCKVVADTLHLSRIAASDQELTEHAAMIPLLQLCDGPVRRPVDRGGLVTESRSERMVPGEGGFRLSHMVAALPHGTPISVEAPSDATVALIGAQAWAHRLKAGADAVIRESLNLRAATEALPAPSRAAAS